ncbi:hypothetical protein PGT21_018915 [Puccinia graminis f. sp. tritici]|uniref:Secreted protein n=1 Tax=Puccinia graminis f. sp. tritici TaxID=56615 RepID=A0A5B0P6A5_PUCGR|nr:hypothetical protein PGT21_018915 [Puccinia graminis f. sp. tritici]KAA1131920.1 hypothetical protein PGTUg99_033787 [Puccinia graminis f. sp. tritici]
MFLMNCFPKASLGLALLPYLVVILHLAQVAPVDARWLCVPHFDDQPGKTTAFCWVTEHKKVTCQKNKCVPFYHQGSPFGSLKFTGCENSQAKKTGVTVLNPRNYHHYSNGDEASHHKGYVAAFDVPSDLWYNCAYEANYDNMDAYICSDCI